MPSSPLTRVAVAIASIAIANRPVAAQESRFSAELRREAEHIAESCANTSARVLINCPYALATDFPIRVSIGNLAPQNRFGVGLALVDRYTLSETWQMSWTANGVVTPSGAWRSGANLKLVRTALAAAAITSRPAQGVPVSPAARDYPVFNVFAQATSLKQLFYFGSGPSSLESGKSVFRERQIIAGGNALLPLPLVVPRLRVALRVGMNGRFVDVGGVEHDALPSIETVYDESTVPGLREQPNFLQFEEGVRIRPDWLGGLVRTNYAFDFKQFRAANQPRDSFHRWTVDLTHDFPLYANATLPDIRDTNGPDECWMAVGSNQCRPPINRVGAIGLRLLITSSSARNGGRVPFYFQPTLGGGNIDGDLLLSAYQDYRFRGPNAIAVQETFEHAIVGPISFRFSAEQGKVADAPRELTLRNLAHSYSLGMMLRAGGFPTSHLSIAWGPEGHRVIATMSATLGGASPRPSLQ